MLPTERTGIKQVTHVKLSSSAMERMFCICKWLFSVLARLYVATLARVICIKINKPSNPSAGYMFYRYGNRRMEGCMAQAVLASVLQYPSAGRSLKLQWWGYGYV